MDDRLIPANIQSEILFVGGLYKQPDLYVSYGNYIRSKYDFYDEATRFFYDCFEIIYRNFAQEEITETKVNLFMSQDDERLIRYRRYKGWKTIEQWMSLADTNDFVNYYNTVKKYSLLREYSKILNRNAIEKLISNENFENYTSDDVYRIIRSKTDNINTVINAVNESIDLTNGNKELLNSYLEVPDMGLSYPWKPLTQMFRGIRVNKLVLTGFISNSGKTRNLMLLAAYIVFVHKQKFLLMSNEMDEKDLRNCLITTLINNECFQNLHGVHMNKPEMEIVLGLYRDDRTNEFMYRKTDSQGCFTESLDEFRARLNEYSGEYRGVMKVAEWLDQNKENRLFFKDMGEDYSDTAIEFEMRKHKMVYDVKYMGYDTMKGYRNDEWQSLKQTATRLKELTKELGVFLWADMQLTDDSIFTDIFQLSSNNIANSKQVRHVASQLILGKEIPKDEYHKYAYTVEDEDWGSSSRLSLDRNKRYFAFKVDKNRDGSKDYILLLEIDLDLNIWNWVGRLVRNG